MRYTGLRDSAGEALEGEVQCIRNALAPQCNTYLALATLKINSSISFAPLLPKANPGQRLL